MFIPAPPPAYTLYLLRHGESVGNLEGYHQGQSDFPLTERGRQQAQALARYWQAQRLKFDCIMASPLLRARETAETVAAAVGAPLELDPAWMERDVGLLAGMKPEAAEARYPRPPFMPPYTHIGQTGESQWELFLRAGQALQGVLERPAGHYLIVSHGGLLNMLIYAMLGLSPQANFTGPRFRFQNTSFATLSYSPAEHAWRVLGINERPHWQGDGAAAEGMMGGLRGSQAAPQAQPGAEATIRPAQEADLAAMCQLYAEVDGLHVEAHPEIFHAVQDPLWRQEHLRAQLGQAETSLLVAERAGELVGVVLTYLRNETGEIPIMARRRYAKVSDLVVRHDQRRRGLGSQLMAAAEEWAQAQGAIEIELNVWEFNQEAMRLYAKLGYERLVQRLRKRLEPPKR
jgi:2,3-bisphosphoglycerate-dependent phosphoglycerate mutase